MSRASHSISFAERKKPSIRFIEEIRRKRGLSRVSTAERRYAPLTAPSSCEKSAEAVRRRAMVSELSGGGAKRIGGFLRSLELGR